MDNPISRAEMKEIENRLDAENERQNHRLNVLEETFKQIHTLTASVERLATNIERMVKEQERQSVRLEKLEARDGELWRKVVGHLLAAVGGGLAAFILSQLGIV